MSRCRRVNSNRHGSLWRRTIRFRNGSVMPSSVYGLIGDRNVWKAVATGWPVACIRKAAININIMWRITAIPQRWASRTSCRCSRRRGGILTPLSLTTRAWEHSISLPLATITTTLTYGTRNINRGTPRTLVRTRTSLTDGRRRQLTALCASPQ